MNHNQETESYLRSSSEQARLDMPTWLQKTEVSRGIAHCATCTSPCRIIILVRNIVTSISKLVVSEYLMNGCFATRASADNKKYLVFSKLPGLVNSRTVGSVTTTLRPKSFVVKVPRQRAMPAPFSRC
jgi:Fe-S oxidoreductase